MAKKIFLSFLLMFSSVAFAGPYHHHGHRHGYHNHFNHNWWVGPVLAGSVLGYALSRPQTVIVESPQPVIVQPQVRVSPSIIIDGVEYSKQIMIINGVQTEVLVRHN